jgi:hypothetical protein
MRRIPWRRIIMLISPSVVVGILALLLMNWRSPSDVQLEVSADRFSFHVAGAKPSQVLNSVQVRSLTIESYSSVELNPEEGEFANTADFSAAGKVSESSWRSLRLDPPVVFKAEQASLEPSITMESAETSHPSFGVVDRLWAKPGTQVTVDSSNPSPLQVSVKFSGQPTRGILSPEGTFRLFSVYAQVSGTNLPQPQPDSQAFRFHLADSSPQVQVLGAPGSLGLLLALEDRNSSAVFSEDGIPVDGIDFTRQNSQGDVESSIVGDGELFYPDDPKADGIKLGPSDVLTLGDMSQFQIRKIAFDRSTQSLNVTASGIARILRTGSPGFVRDRRLTYLDRLRHNPAWLLLFSIVAWVFPTTIAGYKLFKELAQ